ncbi:hypothetical protein BD770DRAFT_416193 [Pilaira anomala]|nr:hypothetical protein BD770DRAFT_416193 [Pilaira anomala]
MSVAALGSALSESIAVLLNSIEGNHANNADRFKLQISYCSLDHLSIHTNSGSQTSILGISNTIHCLPRFYSTAIINTTATIVFPLQTTFYFSHLHPGLRAYPKLSYVHIPGKPQMWKKYALGQNAFISRMVDLVYLKFKPYISTRYWYINAYSCNFGAS